MTIPKKRHGCLTAWLILMIIGNSASALVYVLSSETMKQATPELPDGIFPVLTIICIFNLICAIALFRWKKWGFWGFLGSSVAAFIINMSIGLGIVTSVFGFMGIVILYGLLNLGQDNKGWSQLE